MQNPILYDMSNLQVGDIIFTFMPKSFISKAIWFFSHWKDEESENEPKISHVFVCIGEGLVAEAEIRGIVIKGFGIFRKKRYNVYVKRCTKPFDKTLFANLVKCHAGVTKYALLELFFILFKKMFGIKKSKDVQPNEMHCSEFATYLYKQCGVDLFPGFIPADISPLELYRSRYLESVPIE